VEAESFTLKSNTRFYFEPRQIFYEDVTLNNTCEVSQEKVEQVIKKIDETLNNLFLFEPYFYEQKRMDQFFKTYYPKVSRIDLLNYYEDYFREVKKPIDEFKRDNNNKIIELQNLLINEEQEENKKSINESISKLQSARIPKDLKTIKNQERVKKQKEWSELLKDEFRTDKNHDTFNVASKRINELSRKFLIEENHERYHNSLGTFIQFYIDESSGHKKLKAVVNNLFSGYGKLSSRFLHVLDKDFLRLIREYNLDHQPIGSIYIEDMDASVFNANLHPPLLSKELCMPNGNNSLPQNQQIPVNDMEVKWVKGALGLFDKKSSKRIFVFDMGFQGHVGRSQLFQLAEKFTGTKLLFFSPLLEQIGHPKKTETLSDISDEKVKKDPQILKLPRIVLDDSIILRRRSWMVPRTKLPFKKANESNGEYFVRINMWRKRLKIPDEVFVNVYSNYERYSANLNLKNLSKNDYKPQYINYSIPYTVILFEKLLKKVPVSLRIVEMLPNSKQLLSFGNKKRVSEFLIQWYNYAE